jgi:hypothetical protein
VKNQHPTEKIIIWLYTLLCASLLASAGGWVWGNHALWAFSFLLFVPTWLRVLGALVIVGATIYDLRFTIYDVQVPALLGRIGLIWPLVAGVLFWLLRERTYYGDALLKLELLNTQTLQSDPYVWKEPLDSLLAYTVTGWLRSIQQPPEVAIALLSVLAGMVYVAAVLLVMKWLARPTAAAPTPHATRATLYGTFALLALGSSQLWFGHIENYSLVTAATFLAIGLAVGYLRGQCALGWVGLCSGLAISLHPQAAFAMPALLLLLDRRRWPRQVAILALTGLIGPLLTLLAMRGLGVAWPDFTHGYAGDPQIFFTLPQMLTGLHLLDIVNNLWLIAPLAPLWLVLGIWAWTQSALRGDRVWRYLTAVAAGLLLYHVTFQNDLPRYHDWDLFAIVAPGVTLWGLYAALHTPWQEGMRPALLFAALFTIAWIGVNHTMNLIHPNPDLRATYQRYRLLDLTEVLGQAAVTPATPICAEATNCERVKVTSFTMPQNGDSRPTIFAHAPARIELPLQVPAEATFLWLSPALGLGGRWGDF